jgi:chloramphenicol-sensitive protein RarD
VSAPPPSTHSARGLTAGVIAFTLWGLLPGYWKMLHWLDSGQIIALRALLTLPVLIVVLLWRRELAVVLKRLREPRVLALHALTAALLAGNWLVFVWATHHGFIVEASLGYFLTPLANVAMGALFLGERPVPRCGTCALGGAGPVRDVRSLWPAAKEVATGVAGGPDG